MSKSTRLFTNALRSFISEAKLQGLSGLAIAEELRKLRLCGRSFARNELLRHYSGGC